MLGPRGPVVFAAIVLLSVTVSMLALLVMAPRLYVAMTQDRLFPRRLASLTASVDESFRARQYFQEGSALQSRGASARRSKRRR